MTGHTGGGAGRERDRRPLLIAAVFVVFLISGLGAWPHTLAVLCPSILVASSNEKSQLLTRLAAEYSATRGSPWSGCGPVVTVENVASGDAEHQLETGWPGAGRPDVWTPAASTWVLLLQSRRHDLVPLGAPLESIATSPLVVAMPDPMARALGWPNQEPTWSDLLLMAQDPRGWGRFGRPDWGNFRLGMTDPRTSTSGIHSLIAAYDAATGTVDPSTDDIGAPRSVAFAAAVQASVSHYASTAGIFLDGMAAADSLTYVSAVALEEQEVFNYNEGLHSPERPAQPPRVTLDAIYPAGGTLVADHPFVVLHAPWVDQAKSNIARDFVAWLRDPVQQGRFNDDGFRDDGLNAGHALANEPGILASKPVRLPLPSAATVRAIDESWGALRKPARLSIVLDLADASERAAVDRSIGELLPKDQVAVWVVVNGQLGRILDLTPLDDPGSTRVFQAIDSAPIRAGPGPLYATVEDAYQSLVTNSDRAHINSVVVITAHRDDGTGGGLTVLEREIRARTGGDQVRIYTVAQPGSDGAALTGIEKASGGVPTSWSDPASTIRACVGNF